MLNTIIIILAAAFFVLSAVTVAAEPLIPINSGKGRLLRAVRIRLRELSRTSCCVAAAVIIVIGFVSGDDEKPKMFAVLGVMFAALFVLHPEDFLSVFHHRKGAEKKAHLRPAPRLAGGLPPVKILEELEAVDKEIVTEEGKKDNE